MKPARKSSWFSLTQCAAAFDVTRAVFHQTYRPLVAPQHVRSGGRQVEIHLRGLIDAWTKHETAKAMAVHGLDESGAVILGSGDSPALERARLATAKLRELELAQKLGQMIPLDEIEGALVRFAGAIRQAADMQQRRFGSECADMLNESLDDFERQCAAFIPMQSEQKRLAI